MNPDGAMQFDAIARLFQTLGDTTRLQILHILKESPAYVLELVDKTGLKQSNVSKQLGILHEAGLVARERHGNQIRYSIADPRIFDLCRLVCRKIHQEAKATATLYGQMGG